MAATNLSVDIFVLSDKNATVVSAELLMPDDDCYTGLTPLLTTTGASKREQGDIYDQEIATNLALSRALERMSRQLRRQANAKVRKATTCPA
jgi:uncharacterized protein DUF1876